MIEWQDYNTPLILASTAGHLPCVRELIEQGADPCIRRKVAHIFLSPSFPFFFFFIEIFNTANVVKSIFMIRLWLDGIWTLIPGSARRFHRHRGSANPQRMPSQQSMSSKQSILIQCLHVLVCVCVCVCACVCQSLRASSNFLRVISK